MGESIHYRGSQGFQVRGAAEAKAGMFAGQHKDYSDQSRQEIKENNDK